MSDAKTILEMIKEKNIVYVDYRFTDPRGKWQHLAMHVDAIDEDALVEGIMFDGSSIAGWKAINESDMILRPDLSSAVMDPFCNLPQLIVFCNIVEPSTGQFYNRDPRSTAVLAVEHLKSTGIGDSSFWGPEAEFFVFDDVRYEISSHQTFYFLDSEEGPYNAGAIFEQGNLGHRPGIKGGYFPVPPVDSAMDLRGEMLKVMGEMGLSVEKHHHEVAPSQHELGIKFAPLVQAADGMQIYKYVVQQVAHQYGKTATFMPKPVSGDNGSGMHTHQSIWKEGKPLFAGDGYAGLSETCLHYIGGIIKHAKALNAFTNPSTNSYKRLIPGFEAPVLLAYSARNRSASVRVPWVSSPKQRRLEIRFPDSTSNPYFAFAAMLLAGLDGIQNQMHPGDAMDKDLYDLPPEEEKEIPTVCFSLEQALNSLDADRTFLKVGGVFTDDVIDAYIRLKMDEVTRLRMTTHPVEFDMYYSV